MHHVQLHAISHPAYDLLRGASTPEKPLTARMLASFRRALNLIVGDTVVALVTPDLGNGPFHMVVSPLPPPLARDRCSIWWEAETLHIGPWVLHCSQPIHIWEPQPNWSKVRIRDRQRQYLHHAIASVVRTRTAAPTALPGLPMDQLKSRVESLATAVTSLDLSDVRAAASALCGLGPGLTPSGDDYLAGAMLALWAGHHPQRARLCDAIYEGASGRTTSLSNAFLAAAARGETNEQWHRLLAALSTPASRDPADSGHRHTFEQIECAVRDISTFGATSGMDLLGGFEAGLTWCNIALQ